MYSEAPGTRGKMTRCRCPKCDKHHKIKLRWIGNGMPRIFCQECKLTLSRHGGQDEARYNRWAAFETVRSKAGELFAH